MKSIFLQLCSHDRYLLDGYYVCYSEAEAADVEQMLRSEVARQFPLGTPMDQNKAVTSFEQVLLALGADSDIQVFQTTHRYLDEHRLLRSNPAEVELWMVQQNTRAKGEWQLHVYGRGTFRREPGDAEVSPAPGWCLNASSIGGPPGWYYVWMFDEWFAEMVIAPCKTNNGQPTVDVHYGAYPRAKPDDGALDYEFLCAHVDFDEALSLAVSVELRSELNRFASQVQKEAFHYV